MDTYLIQNDNNRFGYIIELKIEEHTTNFKIYKIDAIGDDENEEELHYVELIVDGYLKWDGCSNLNFGKDGYIHFCETDDLVCLNKSLAFVWELARKQYSYSEYVDEWKIKNDGITNFKGKFKLQD